MPLHGQEKVIYARCVMKELTYYENSNGIFLALCSMLLQAVRIIARRKELIGMPIIYR